MTPIQRFRLHPLAIALPMALVLQGCATDPNTGAQKIAGIQVSDDPCAKTNTVVGGVIGAVAGAVVTSQFTKNTDARVLGATLKAGETASYPLGKDRRAYLVPASGAVEIDGVRVNARDGAAIADLDTLTVTALEDSEIVMVDAA